MKIRTASTLAALALGLMLSGTAAYAAEGNGAQGDQGQHQNGDGDKKDHGDNDKNHRGKPDAKPPVTAPTNTNAPNNANNGNNGNNANNANNWNNRNGDNTRRADQRHPKNWNNKNTNRRVVDMSRWHRNANSQRQYHAGAYHAPRGYSYVRYGYGQRLPRDYYARSFWLIDFLNFGLMLPPEGYTWVRYGPDALLIDEETGEIVQVQYNVFYS